MFENPFTAWAFSGISACNLLQRHLKRFFFNNYLAVNDSPSCRDRTHLCSTTGDFLGSGSLLM